MLHTRWGQPIRLEELFLGHHEVTMGRNSGNTLVLSSKLSATSECKIPDGLVLQLSRVHARMALKDGCLQIQDLATLNGTYINNVRLPKEEWRVLSDGDIVTLGGSDPLALDGNVVKNPWRFAVQGLQEFLATRPRIAAAAAVLPESHPNSGATGAATTVLADGSAAPAREVYSFSNPAPRVDRSTEVIDLTLDDSPPAQPKAKRPRVTSAAVVAAAAQPSTQGGGSVEFYKKMLEHCMCPICVEPLVGAYSVAPCGHAHCGACLLEWLGSRAGHPTCPMCRKDCTGPPVRSNLADSSVTTIMEKLSAEERGAWEERVKEWEANRQDIEAKLKTAVRVGGMANAGRSMGVGEHYVAVALGALGALPGDGGYPMPQQRRRPAPRAPARVATPPASQNFRVQYATGAEMCVRCHSRVPRDALIMGIGTGGGGGRRGQPQGNYSWHHLDCFPAQLWPAAVVAGVENMRQLRAVDASRVRDRLGGMAG